MDFIILDCSSHVINFFTPTAIEASDLAIRILTPDLRGVNYLKAHQPLLTDAKFHFEDHLTFAGMARPFHAIDEMGHLIGGLDGLLPYAKEIERCGTSGEMFHALGYCNKHYLQSLKLVKERLQPSEEMILPDDTDGEESSLEDTEEVETDHDFTE